MKTFSMFFSEDAGEKFNKMDDSQFADWKKNNPGAAAKADQLRKKARMEKDSSAIVKAGTPSSDTKSLGGNKGLKGEVQKKLTDTAKKLAAERARKLAGSVKGAVSGGMRDYEKEKEAREQAKKDAEDNMTVKQRLKDRFDNSYLGKKGGKKRGDAIYDAPGKVAAFLARQARSSVGSGGDVAWGQEMSGLRQR